MNMQHQKEIEALRTDIVARDGMCVSADTTREDHLIVAFSNLLRSYDIKHQLLDEATDRIAIWQGTDMRSYDPCEFDDLFFDFDFDLLLDELFDLMEDLAPEGFWFGAQEGDAACFGFWRCDSL